MGSRSEIAKIKLPDLGVSAKRLTRSEPRPPGRLAVRLPEDRGRALRSAQSIEVIEDRQLSSGCRNCFISRGFKPGGQGRGGLNWRERKSVRSPHAASPGGFACPSLPPGFSERARERLPAEAMALHVPKAPGFAQMLKEGAKVSMEEEGVR